MSITKESILKAILLKEFDRMQPEISTFEDDPMQFILRKYQGLNKVLTYLMTPSFEEYITGIYVVAPKPTTFKIVLHNGQFFFLQFMGKAYQATVAGKNYYLMNIGEKERCMLAIARILRFGNPLKTKGPEGAEQATREEGGGESTGGEEVPEATPEEGGGEEEALAEAKILEEILKKNITEQEESKEGFSSSEDFEKFVNQKYLGLGQKISGLNFLYDKINSSDNSAKLFSLIKESGNKTIKPGEYEISDNTEKELFEFTKVVTIPNGNFSELWFAIVYNGKVVGGKKSEETGDAVTDVLVDNKKVSLKNYSSSGTIDLGTLEPDKSKAFNKLLNFISIITGVEIDATIPVSSLNNILNSISNEDIKEFLESIKDSKNKSLQTLYNYIKHNNLENLKEKFIDNLNSIVIDKINKVDYWVGIFLDKIYIKSSEELSKLLKSSSDEISTGITSLKGNHLFVNGNVVFLGKEKGVRELSGTPIKINKENYKSIKSPTTNKKIVYVNKSWVKKNPEYEKNFDYNKTHPTSKDFIMLKPDSKINFDIVDSNLPKKED